MEQTVEELTAQELQAVLKQAFPTDETFILSRNTRTRRITQPQDTLLFRPDLFPHYIYTLINTLIESFNTESDRDSDPDYTDSEIEPPPSEYTHSDTEASSSPSPRSLLPMPLFGYRVKTWSTDIWESFNQRIIKCYTTSTEPDR
jgi:hypothetical protein